MKQTYLSSRNRDRINLPIHIVFLDFTQFNRSITDVFPIHLFPCFEEIFWIFKCYEPVFCLFVSISIGFPIPSPVLQIDLKFVGDSSERRERREESSTRKNEASRTFSLSLSLTTLHLQNEGYLLNAASSVRSFTSFDKSPTNRRNHSGISLLQDLCKTRLGRSMA